MRGLELGQFVPGQRLVETDLAQRFGVGRNAVREAIQWLAAQGVIDVTRHRSPSIRLLGEGEASEILDAAAAIVGLAARSAARAWREDSHGEMLTAALDALASAREAPDFARARRHFYETLLAIGGNRELPRLFRVSGMHILYAQYRAASGVVLDDFQAIAKAVALQKPNRAEAAGRAHIENVRAALGV